MDGEIGFANGTADDIILASGSIVSGSVVFQNGAGHADFVEAMTATRAGLAFLHGSLLPGSTLEQLLTTPTAVRSTHPNADGSSTSVINGGTATAALVPPHPTSLPGQSIDGFIPALLQAEILAAFSAPSGSFAGDGTPRGCATPRDAWSDRGGPWQIGQPGPSQEADMAQDCIAQHFLP